MKLILVRHGQTPSNVAKILDTALPGAPLTEQGVAQARAFGSALATPPRALFSSTALRARQTAQHIGEVTGVLPETLDDLHEVQLGELEGRNDDPAHQQFKEVFHAWHTGDLDARPPGGESGRDILGRMIPVLTALRQHYPLDGRNGAAGDVYVVSHGSAIRLVSRYLADVPGLFSANNHLDNTGTVELTARTDGGWECVRWGRFTPPFVQVSPIADIPMG
ncbi:MAG: histidine phosphatase family protein [Mycobacteriaceae bacterium]|nr:histidine phosphatase family protein [Mycobacteriaceae bacterium]